MTHRTPAPIRTSRLTLTPLDPGDAVEMVGVLADADLYLFTGGDPPSLAALEDLGFAREGAAAVEDRLAGNGTKRMLAHIHPHHAASQEVAKAIGMVSTDTRDEEGEIAWVIEVASTEPIPDQTLDA